MPCRRFEGELGGSQGFAFALEVRFGGGTFSASLVMAFCLPADQNVRRDI